MSDAALAPGSRAWFQHYIDAFNSCDFDAFGDYYDDHVQFYGQAATLKGHAEVLAFYRQVRERVVETIEVLSFVGSNARIAAELRTTLEAKFDWPELRTGPLRQGERRESVNFAFYDIAKGKFTHIRSARFHPLAAGPK